MNRQNGSSLTELEHIKQSVQDILTTRIGTRIARREYGSLLPELIDQPQNEATRLRLFAATAMALMNWEPRIRLSRVQFFLVDLSGRAELDLDGVLVDSNQPFNLAIPLQLGASA
ncbi:GPW/gp25 family protein [Pseudomonas sp. Irchel 3E13]|uniref:GPW/gp25 family protein n=1 Tax=Pseudomonas sp. Irchel 3E13 TaxID=2008975 RepID=UPI000BA44EF8|nr:GPW/gp25 family protein [Pseudomonas sp. Irchel 3E13]